MEIPNLPAIRALRPAWIKGRIVGQKRPLKPKHVWAIRVRLVLAENHRDLALFNLAIDSKLRGCDLVKMKVIDVMASGEIKERASVLQSKTNKPVRFEIMEGTRMSLERWMEDPLMVGSEYLWPGRFHERLHISTRQYARIVRDWVTSIGLEATAYGTHSMRRTKVTQIYKKTGKRRVVVAMREREGRTLPFMRKSEGEGVELANENVSRLSPCQRMKPAIGMSCTWAIMLTA